MYNSGLPHLTNKWKISVSILRGDTNLFAVASGTAPGVKICQIKHVERPAVVTPCE